MSLSSSLSVGDARKFLNCSTLTQALWYFSSSFGIYMNVIMPTRYFRFQVCLSASSSNHLVFKHYLLLHWIWNLQSPFFLVFCKDTSLAENLWNKQYSLFQSLEEAAGGHNLQTKAIPCFYMQSLCSQYHINQYLAE